MINHPYDCLKGCGEGLINTHRDIHNGYHHERTFEVSTYLAWEACRTSPTMWKNEAATLGGRFWSQLKGEKVLLSFFCIILYKKIVFSVQNLYVDRMQISAPSLQTNSFWKHFYRPAQCCICFLIFLSSLLLVLKALQSNKICAHCCK